MTSAILTICAAMGILLPILALIGAAAGTTVGALRVPVGQIAFAVFVGYALALLFLVLCIRRRSGAIAWILGVAAVISAVLVSVWPLVATALAGVTQVQNVIPFIQALLN